MQEYREMVRLELKQTTNKNPEWLDLILQSKFFTPCLNLNHEELRRVIKLENLISKAPCGTSLSVYREMVRLGLKQTSNKYPEWLDLLLQSKFFIPCLNLNHEELRRGEINVFCIDCKACLCQHCFATPMHSGHKQLQIRRYMYRDVVKIDDMQKLMNCSHVMPYTLNSAKVVLLNPRPQATKPPTKSNETGPKCMRCERMLVGLNRYCSISCKVLYESENNGCDAFELSQIEKMEMEMEVKDNNNADMISSTGSVHSNENNNSFDNLDEYNSPFHLNLKPKMTHKRKGVPRRSPFF